MQRTIETKYIAIMKRDGQIKDHEFFNSKLAATRFINKNNRYLNSIGDLTNKWAHEV